MGKSAQSLAAFLQEFSRVHHRPTSQIKPAISRTRPSNSSSSPATRLGSQDRQQQLWPQLRVENKNMEGSNSNPNSSMSPLEQSLQRGRRPLANVVADCVKRWFRETLKEAKHGDTSMQVLVSQMYYSGYGVPKDAQKGKAWMNRASRTRSSVWEVSDKHPGYNASDSDSDDSKVVAE